MRYYRNFPDDMILRDYLALDRTILANRRTLLAYIRTSVGLLAGGIGMINLLAGVITNVIGYIFIFLSVPIMIIGMVAFLKLKTRLALFDKSNMLPLREE